MPPYESAAESPAWVQLYSAPLMAQSTTKVVRDLLQLPFLIAHILLRTSVQAWLECFQSGNTQSSHV